MIPGLRFTRVLAGLGLVTGLALAAWWLGPRQSSAPAGPRALTPPAALHALILRRGIGPEPESLDPHRARSEAALTVLRDLYQGLTELGPGGIPVMAAAERYEVSGDGLTYTFRLRANGRWSNGDTVVAEDFAAAWRRLVNPQTAAPYAQLLAPVRGASAITAGSASPDSLGVRVLDEATLVVDLVRPTPYFLGLLSHPATFPLHRASLAANGRRFARPGMISNGAFVLSGWDFGSHVSARRNPYYWERGKNAWDGVDYYSMPEAAAEFRAYRSGELDLTSTVPAAQAEWIKAHMAADLRIAPQLAVYYLGLNLTRAPFDKNPSLRQALSMVIDRERLVESVTGLGEAAAYSLVPPQVFNYGPAAPEYAAWPLATRVQRARELLRLAGLHQPLKIELRYNSGELHSRIAVAVASMWKESLGVETTLHAQEFKVLLQDIDRAAETQVFRASWIADYNDAYNFLQLMQSGFGINLPRYSNPEYDALLARANQNADATQRRELLEKAEGLMMADQPLIPIYFYVAAHLVRPQIRGWSENPMNVVYAKSLTKDRL